MAPKGEKSTQLDDGSVVFTLRLWQADQDGDSEWRGRVQNVMSGDAHYFRDWEKLVELLKAMLADSGEDCVGA